MRLVFSEQASQAKLYFDNYGVNSKSSNIDAFSNANPVPVQTGLCSHYGVNA